MSKDVYIVTGATGGIGKAIVSDLCVRDEVKSVILACRNVGKAQQFVSFLATVYPYKELIVLPLDLESFASVRAFGEEVVSRGYKIKALIHNAGTMPGEVRVTGDGYESATQTNFLSPMLLTELLVDNLLPDANVVFTTSMTRRIARFIPDWADKAITRHVRFVTYGRSKKMLTGYALMLAMRLKDRGICVNCSDPWIVDTGIITMGNKIIDPLSNMLFRPLIYTPEQGAASAISALDSSLSGYIFTRKSHAHIPPSYGSEPVRNIITKAYSDIE